MVKPLKTFFESASNGKICSKWTECLIFNFRIPFACRNQTNRPIGTMKSIHAANFVLRIHTFICKQNFDLKLHTCTQKPQCVACLFIRCYYSQWMHCVTHPVHMKCLLKIHSHSNTSTKRPCLNLPGYRLYSESLIYYKDFHLNFFLVCGIFICYFKVRIVNVETIQWYWKFSNWSYSNSKCNCEVSTVCNTKLDLNTKYHSDSILLLRTFS